MSAQFLDCTLRDGAHVNSGNFGESHIKNIVAGLTEASIDIVEIGFLKNVEYSREVTYVNGAIFDAIAKVPSVRDQFLGHQFL